MVFPGDAEPAVAGSCTRTWIVDGSGICKGTWIGQGTGAGCPAHVRGRLCLRRKQPQELMMAVGACLVMTDFREQLSRLITELGQMPCCARMC